MLRADGTEIIPPSKYSEVSPSIIYEIIVPLFNSMKDEHQHRQVADKAFKEKSRQALTRYLEEQQFSFRELDRVIKADDRIIAEWEGVSSGGRLTIVIQNCRLRSRGLEFFMRMEQILLLSTVEELKVARVHCIFAVGVFFDFFQVCEKVKR